MKTIDQPTGHIDPARFALLLGLSIGMGIAVHEAFFLVAGAIAIGALTAAAMHGVQEHGRRARSNHQHN